MPGPRRTRTEPAWCCRWSWRSTVRRTRTTCVVPFGLVGRYGQGMTVDPRAALDRLVAALEAHHAAVSSRRGDEDSSVDDAYDILADAFDVYDEAVGNVYGEALPFVLADDDDDDDGEHDDGDDGDEGDDDIDEDDLDDDDIDGADLDDAEGAGYDPRGDH